jgi:hypothetical protein
VAGQLNSTEKSKMAAPSNRIKWTAKLEATKAISIRQPWAWLIVNGYKPIENRSRRTHLRGTILVHAGANRSEFVDLCNYVRKRHGVVVPEDVEFGGVIGAVDLVDCMERSKSPWHTRGYWGWVLENPRRLRFRPCKGALSQFVPVFDD